MVRVRFRGREGEAWAVRTLHHLFVNGKQHAQEGVRAALFLLQEGTDMGMAPAEQKLGIAAF